ncbi:MAG: hypothetical protein WBZ42_08985, partial [Halobacteriota archaeon]
MYALIFPNILFLRALVLSAIIIAVIDTLMFYVIWSGKRQITPLFVVEAIIVTMVPLAINLWFHIFPYSLFLRALVLTAIIVSVTDALMFYVIWSGRTKITPLFVVEAIIV